MTVDTSTLGGAAEGCALVLRQAPRTTIRPESSTCDATVWTEDLKGIGLTTVNPNRSAPGDLLDDRLTDTLVSLVTWAGQASFNCLRKSAWISSGVPVPSATITDAFRRKKSTIGWVFSRYSRIRARTAASLSSPRWINEPPQTSHTPSRAGRWKIRL